MGGATRPENESAVQGEQMSVLGALEGHCRSKPSQAPRGLNNKAWHSEPPGSRNQCQLSRPIFQV